jgi:hypothetical protein
MDKKFLCLTSTDGCRIRRRADSILEYGDLYAEDQMTDGSQAVVVGDKRIAGSYINTTCQDDVAVWVTETVEQLDKMLSELKYELVDAEYCGETHDLAENIAADTHWQQMIEEDKKNREEWSKKAAGGIIMPADIGKIDGPFKKLWDKYKVSQPEDPEKWDKAFDGESEDEKKTKRFLEFIKQHLDSSTIEGFKKKKTDLVWNQLRPLWEKFLAAEKEEERVPESDYLAPEFDYPELDAMDKKTRQGVEKILAVMGELDWSGGGMNLFLNQERECWAGMTPIQMVALGKEDVVVKFLERLRDGDPVA